MLKNEIPVKVSNKFWLTELEGLRGLAALWVLSLHVSIMAGTKIPIISWGALGVDLFILLSGFLMVHQYERSKESKLWPESKRIGHFWCRRFFRMAPLYYLLLAVALAAGPLMAWSRLSIGRHYPASMTDTLRYTDRSWANALVHFSFVFGFLPRFSFRTALPDWSIGLEMQFYLLFPFLMIVAKRFGYVLMAVGTLVLTVAAYFAFPQFFGSFPMPSFLPIKINLFLLGMLIAAAFHKKLRFVTIFIVLLPIVSFVVTSQKTMGVIADIVLASFLLLVTGKNKRLSPALVPIKWLLNGWVAQKLGDISYSLYLVHLLLLMPISAVLLRFPQVSSMPDLLRFSVLFGITLIFVIPVSTLLYYGVEKPGIEVGKRLLSTTVTKELSRAAGTGA